MNKNLIIVFLLITNACGSAIANEQSTRLAKTTIQVVDLETQWQYAHEVIWELKAIVDANTDVKTDDCLQYPNTIESCKGLYEFNDKKLKSIENVANANVSKLEKEVN